MSANIFEQASRDKLRFGSNRGELTVEQLWDLSLTSRQGFDLDTVAKEVSQSLKEQNEESFVVRTSNPLKAQLQLKLDILKYVIEVKQTEADERRNVATRAAERQRLMDALAERKDQAIKELSVEELEARLAQLK